MALWLLNTIGVGDAPITEQRMAVATSLAANEPVESLMVSLDDNGLLDQAAA